MRLLSILKRNTPIDWHKRVQLLHLLEEAWLTRCNYRFGQYLSNVFEEYRIRGFDLERGIPFNQLNDRNWMTLIEMNCRHSGWKLAEYDPEIDWPEHNPNRISGMVKGLDAYWRCFPHRKFGDLIQELTEMNGRDIYSTPDHIWMEWFNQSEEKLTGTH